MRRLILHCASTRVAAALAASVLLAACGSTGAATGTQNTGTQNAGTQNAGTQSTGNQAAAQTRSVTTTTITSTASPASTSSASGPPACRASGLALRFLAQQGATGHGELGFAVRNTGSAPCRTLGYPGVQFLDAAGRVLPTRSQRVTDDFFGSAPVVEIVLAPGASASFRLGVTHGTASRAGCTSAHGLQVYPPDDTATLRTTIPEGAAECGTATVSPMQPGSSAYR